MAKKTSRSVARRKAITKAVGGWRITAVLRNAEAGPPVGDLCRQAGICEQTFYRWKKSNGSMLRSEARELKQLREENARLNRVVADLTLDKVMLQDIVHKQF